MTGLLRAVALFSVAPVRRGPDLSRSDAVAALRWFPLVGAGLGGLAGLPLAAVRHFTPHAALLGAALSVAVLVLLTRGLHLDGLADTADGLGSHQPAERALEIMRRSDIGPFGVIAIVLILAVDLTALASVEGPAWRPVAALAVAAATGRVAVLHAAARGVRSARPSGFGAFVAGSMPPAVLVGQTAILLAGTAGLAAAVGAGPLGWLLAALAALLVCAAGRVHAVRRLGGVTGDVFGALVEVGTAVALAGLALS